MTAHWLVFVFLFSLQTYGSTIKCETAYNLTQEENIEHSHLNELVISNEENQYLGISIENQVFQLKTFRNWNEVSTFYKSISLSDRKLLSNLIRQRRIALTDSINQILNLSNSLEAKVAYRFKDVESLKKKIFDRLKKFNSIQKDYKVIDLADILGFRITLDANTNVLQNYKKEDWAKLLGIDAKQIYELEVKGTEQDIATGKYYRAIHLIIIGKDGANFEVQIMSQPMAIWHRWDHKYVYKNPDRSSPEYSKLKKYSDFWGQFINTFSANHITSREDLRKSLQQYCVDWGLPVVATIPQLNAAIIKKLQFAPDKAFGLEEVQQLELIYKF